MFISSSTLRHCCAGEIKTTSIRNGGERCEEKERASEQVKEREREKERGSGPKGMRKLTDKSERGERRE